MSTLLVLALLAQAADPLAEGNKALEAKDYARAVELFSQAASADRTDYGAEFQLALTYNLMNRDAEAIAHYKAALVVNPELREAQVNLGLSLLRTRDAAGAIPYLESAAAKKSTLDAEIALAQALSTTDRLSEAESHFRKAAALDASHKADILELAGRYEQSGKRAEAIAIYREFPDHPGAQARIGVLLAESGQVADSIKALEASLARAPTGANRLALADVYLKANQLAKAADTVAPAVAAQPRDLELRMFYGRLLRDQRKLQDAAIQFFAATQLKPDSVEAWNELASALANSEQYAQALTALDRLRALGADTPGSLFYRALSHDHLSQIPEALQAYKQFLNTSQGKFPNQEFQARQRVRILEAQQRKNR